MRLCYENGVEVTSLPGACACVTALTLSGLSTRRFCFEAFLPSDKKEKQEVLEELKDETRTIIIYEAPHRLVRTLKELLETLGDRRMTVLRELTKKHETAFTTTLSEAVAYYEAEAPRGECVLVLEGRSRQQMKEESQAAWKEMDIEEHMARMIRKCYYKNYKIYFFIDEKNSTVYVLRALYMLVNAKPLLLNMRF